MTCDSLHIRQEKIRLSNGFQKSFIFHCLFSKKCHYDSEGVQGYQPRKGGNGAYGKITGAYRHLTGDQHRGEKPRRQADADREGSGSLRSRKGGARQENEERMEALMRKKVFICSPFRGDMEGNARKAAAYSRMACEQGFLPVAPHLLFPQFLNEGIEEERRLGISMGMELLALCDEVWVFGEATEGMAAEIAYATEQGKEIIFRETEGM